MFERLVSGFRAQTVVPPLSPTLTVVLPAEDESSLPVTPVAEVDPVAGLACFITYNTADGRETFRSITCHRIERRGETSYVQGLCHKREAIRLFRIDRISEVADIATGEVLGDGSFFDRFRVDSSKDAKSDNWGLSRSRKATLLAGLNALAFMAKIDGQWHPLEAAVIERFVCSMWLQKEWEGEPPLGEIIRHARNLAPDSHVFFASLKNISHSDTSTRLLVRMLHQVAAADGVIKPEEFAALNEMEDFIRAIRDEAFYSGLCEATTIAITLTSSISGPSSPI